MFRRILAPVDGSTFSEHGLRFAAHAARSPDATLDLLLVHVRYAPVSAEMTVIDEIEQWQAQQKQQETDYLQALAGRLTSEYGVRTRATTVDGDIVPSVEQAIREQNADLVVLTTHGRAGLERAWLGSVADALIRRVEIPVLLVRPSDDGPPSDDRTPVRYDHVVIALDGGELAERSIAPAIELAGEAARFTVLRAVAPPSGITSPYLPHAALLTKEEMDRREAEAEDYVERVAARLTASGSTAAGAVRIDYHDAHAILDYARENNADLIALSTHGRGPVARLLIGSVTDKVVRAATVPVLVC